jgi:hypothetical protein
MTPADVPALVLERQHTDRNRRPEYREPLSSTERVLEAMYCSRRSRVPG